MSVAEQLTALWKDKDVEVLESYKEKYVVISDLHMGNKSKADDFKHNENIVKHALDYYKKKKYKLILLGDIEERWQFDLENITSKYGDLYAKIKTYGDDRVYRVFGNHDNDWEKNYNNDPIRNESPNLKPVAEALKMKDKKGDVRILLVHGHQGTLESDRFSWLSRPLVHFYGDTLERVIDFDKEPSATKSMVLKNYEKKRYLWAKKNKAIIICGHSHRAIFASESWVDTLEEQILELQTQLGQKGLKKKEKKKIIKQIIKLTKQNQVEKLHNREIETLDDDPLPCYFNSGCGMYKDGITVIEIVDDTISLKKWDESISTSAPAKTYGRKGKPMNLSKIIKRLDAS